MLVDIASRIENGQRVVAEADERFTSAERAYELAMARALLVADGANAEARKAKATIATEQERIARDVAGLALRDAKARMRALQDKADLYRSVGSSVRASLVMS